MQSQKSQQQKMYIFLLEFQLFVRSVGGCWLTIAMRAINNFLYLFSICFLPTASSGFGLVTSANVNAQNVRTANRYKHFVSLYLRARLLILHPLGVCGCMQMLWIFGWPQILVSNGDDVNVNVNVTVDRDRDCDACVRCAVGFDQRLKFFFFIFKICLHLKNIEKTTALPNFKPCLNNLRS